MDQRLQPASEKEPAAPRKRRLSIPSLQFLARKKDQTSTVTAWQQLRLPIKLLVLTTAFVMLAEILIFVPSVANYRVNWLNDRLMSAYLAALAAQGAPDGRVPSALRDDLLKTAAVKAVSWKRDGRRSVVLPPADEAMTIDAVYDQRPMQSMGLLSATGERFQLIGEALAVLGRSEDRTLRVTGPLEGKPGDFIEIVIPEAPMREALWQYARNILVLSIIISLFTAALVYIALSNLLVRPMMRITENMLHFAENPEDPGRIIEPSTRGDEVGVAERELASMQRQLSQLLLQKNRLAQLGLAVSKINHDLRNMLASAQLISDRLTGIDDPTVQRFAPKLITSLDRAIDFCNATLKFGRAEEATPNREMILLRPLVEEVGDGLALPREDKSVAWKIDMDAELRVDADRDHLYRVLSNICRNSLQAIESQTPPVTDGEIAVTATRDDGQVTIAVRDNGPGLPPRARERLFQAFQSSQRKGGSGLGLAIAYELIAAHGGTIELLERPQGAAFQLIIPDRPAKP